MPGYAVGAGTATDPTWARATSLTPGTADLPESLTPGTPTS